MARGITVWGRAIIEGQIILVRSALSSHPELRCIEHSQIAQQHAL